MITKKLSDTFTDKEMKILNKLNKGLTVGYEDFYKEGITYHGMLNFLVKCHRNDILLFEDDENSNVKYGLADKYKVLNVKDEYLGF